MDASNIIDGLLQADMQAQIARIANDMQQLAIDSRRPTCGRCNFWMMSSQCPQERNVNGISKGPSSGSKLAVTCQKFEMSQRAKERTAKLERDTVQASRATKFDELPA